MNAVVRRMVSLMVEREGVDLLVADDRLRLAMAMV